MPVVPLAEASALVAVGAVTGALARWRLSVAATPSWPATAGINVAGSFALGAAAGAYGGSSPSSRPRIMLALGTGFMGAFTTFSTFSLDVVTLVEQGSLSRALGVAVGTPVLGVGAAAAGLALGRRWVSANAAAAAAAASAR